MEQALKESFPNTKNNSRTFRVLWVILILGMLGGGLSQLFKIDYQVDQFNRLGYPPYFMIMLGTTKVLGAVVLLLHRWPILTVAAYSGAFFLSISAFLSHLISNDPLLITLNPLVLLAITIGCTKMDPSLEALWKGKS